MSFQWLQMRITEEKDRRERENNILARMPAAFDELRLELLECLADYNQAFGADAATLDPAEAIMRVRVGDARVDVTLDPVLPGFQIDQAAGRMSIEVGVLPNGNLYYRDAEKYLTLEELTRKILDRVLFPKLKE